MDSKQSLWDGVFCDLDWIQNKVYTYNEYQSWFCHLSDWHSRPVLALEIIVSHSFCTFTMLMTVIFIKKRPSLMLSRRMVMEQILVMSVVLPRDIMAEMVDTWVTPATMGLAEQALAMWLVFNCSIMR